LEHVSLDSHETITVAWVDAQKRAFFSSFSPLSSSCASSFFIFSSHNATITDGTYDKA